MPNVVVALPNIGGALYSMPQSLAKVWLTSTTTRRAVTLRRRETTLKCGGVPQTNETVSATSGPKFTILWGHLEDILPDDQPVHIRLAMTVCLLTSIERETDERHGDLKAAHTMPPR